MKKLKMINLQTEECEKIPADEFETIILKRDCFDEGWWKGFTMATVSIVAGLVIGEVLCNTIWKSKDEA